LQQHSPTQHQLATPKIPAVNALSLLSANTMELIQQLKYNFARNLQQLRAKNKLTQAGLAEQLNTQFKEYGLDIQRTSIVNYEAENALPRLDVMHCIARFFGSSIDAMLDNAANAPKTSALAKAPEKHYGPAFYTPYPDQPDTEQQTTGRGLSADTLKTVVNRCSEALAYRQFFQEFMHQFYHTLLNEASTEAERAQIRTTLHKIFLGCRVSKGKFFQDLINNALSDHEKEVFLAFQDATLSSGQIAEAMGTTTENLAQVFANAQAKLNEYLTKQSNF
jgi:DNA-binding XRE family transcriptional regulator